MVLRRMFQIHNRLVRKAGGTIASITSMLFPKHEALLYIDNNLNLSSDTYIVEEHFVRMIRFGCVFPKYIMCLMVSN